MLEFFTKLCFLEIIFLVIYGVEPSVKLVEQLKALSGRQ